MKKLILAVPAVMLLSSVALAHPGGRDAYGGHYDKDKGTYHVHEGPLEGRTYKNQENMIKTLKQTPGGPAIVKKAEQGQQAAPAKQGQHAPAKK